MAWSGGGSHVLAQNTIGIALVMVVTMGMGMGVGVVMVSAKMFRKARRVETVISGRTGAISVGHVMAFWGVLRQEGCREVGIHRPGENSSG